MIEPIPQFEGMQCTICTTYDCNLRCRYDLPAGTKILMSDFSEKNIEDVIAGDKIIGFTEKPLLGKFRKFECGVVEAAGPTRKLTEAYKYTLADGSEIIASGEHPFVNQRNVFQKTEDFYNSAEKDKRVLKDRLPRNLKLVFSKEYKIGYVLACWFGDGEIKYALNAIANKNSFNHGARFVVKDEDIMSRMRQFMSDLGFEFSGYLFKISKKNNLTVRCIYLRGTEVDKFNLEIIKPYYGKCNTEDYLKGFFAGAYDCEGTCDGCYNTYKITNSDDTYLSTVCDALEKIGDENKYSISEPKDINHCHNCIPLNINICRDNAVKMITETNPACLRKYSDGIEKHGYYDRVPVKIEKIAIPETQFYNLTTSSRTFIANGIYVHNCYEIDKRNVEIPEEYMYKFIDKILEDPDPVNVKGTKDEWIINSGLVFDFIGGDSFMNPDLMDKALSYFQYKANMMGHKCADRWRASISSNGTLFGSKAVQKLINKWGDNLSIGISIDGCPAIHDAYRIFRDHGSNGEEIGTMKTIMHWWHWLKERAPDATDGTKSTCSKASIPYFYDSLRFMHDTLGIRYIMQNFIMEDTGCTDEDYVELEEQYRKCTDYLIEHRHELYWSMFDKQGLNKRSDNYKDHDESMKTGVCGSGCMPTLGMDGTIYPCFRWLGHTQLDGDNQSRPMCVGNINDGFVNKAGFERVRAADRNHISSAYCKECDCEAACAYCIGGCYAENHDFIRTEHICTIAKIRQKWARRYWDRIEELEHNHSDYFSDYRPTFDIIDVPSVDVKESIMRYDDEGNLKPGIEPTEEEIKFEKDMKYWFDKAARDTEVLRIARGQNDVVINTIKTKSGVKRTDEELEYQIHG